MIRLTLILALATVTTAKAEIDYGTTLRLENPEIVHYQMENFAYALRSKNFALEQAFRSGELKFWYKTMNDEPEIIPADSSVAFVGFLDSIQFNELYIDVERRLIMRTFYTEPGEESNKHRYAYHVDESGKIDGILYVPPVTPEYFENWTYEDFETLRMQLGESAHPVIDSLELEWEDTMMPVHYYGCGDVMPYIEAIEETIDDRTGEPINKEDEIDELLEKED